MSRFTFRPQMKPNVTLVDHSKRTAAILRYSKRKMNFSLLIEKSRTQSRLLLRGPSTKIMTPLCGLFAPFGWRTTAWRSSRTSWGMGWDPNNVQRWKHEAVEIRSDCKTIGAGSISCVSSEPRGRPGSEVFGWIRMCKKCGQVSGHDSTGVELGGCGVFTDDVCQWIDKCLR